MPDILRMMTDPREMAAGIEQGRDGFGCNDSNRYERAFA